MGNSEFKFNDHSIEVKRTMSSNIEAALLEVSAELVSQTAKNTAVDTGQLKGSWTSNVSSTNEQHTANIGSPLENAIWEEFGTGEYALKGDGRKGGWFYVDAKGDGHFTHGKRPRRAFWNAYSSLKAKRIKRIQDAFKRGIV